MPRIASSIICIPEFSSFLKETGQLEILFFVVVIDMPQMLLIEFNLY